MARNMHGWFVDCVNPENETRDEVREITRGLTKTEALIEAEMAEGWEHVLIGQVCAKYPRGVYHGGIVHGRKFGIYAEWKGWENEGSDYSGKFLRDSYVPHEGFGGFFYG